MADRYWVGGSATWDATAGTKWATTSGGAGGAAVPTSSDNVFFNTASGSVTVTIAASATIVCGSFNATGFTGTFTWGNSVTFQVYGDFILSTTMTLSHGTGNWVDLMGTGSRIIRTSGKDLGFSTWVASGNYELMDSFTASTKGLEVTGALNLGRFNVSLGGAFFGYNGSTTTATGSNVSAQSFQFDSGSTLIGGTFTGTIGSGTPWWVSTSATLSGLPSVIFSAATSSTRTFTGGNKSYNAFTCTVASSTGTISMQGSNSFKSINVSGGSRTLSILQGTTQTVEDFNVFGTAGNLVTVKGALAGTASAIVKSGTGIVDDVDYVSLQDLTVSPDSRWYAGANSTNVSGNTGWIFTADPYVTTDPVEIALNDPGSTPTVDTDHEVTVRARASVGSGVLSVELRQGSTVIYSWTHDITSTFTDYTKAIPSANVANITEYQDLRLYIFGDVTSGQSLDISQAFLTTPSGTDSRKLAGGASATGVANNGTVPVEVDVTPTTASATGAANNPTITRAGRPLATNAAATGVSNIPSRFIRPTSQSASSTGTANNPTPTRQGRPLAQAPAGTGTANNATITRTGEGDVTAAATGIGVSNNPQRTIATTSQSLVKTGTANNATVVAVSLQVSRPDSDVLVTGWTNQVGGTTNLWDSLNETSPSHTDYVTAVTV